jgi:hypothetical protein
MWNFLEGIGPYPLPFPGAEPQGHASEDPLVELRRRVAGPEFQRDVERSARFMVVAERENNEMEDRIEAAISIRRSVRGD